MRQQAVYSNGELGTLVLGFFAFHNFIGEKMPLHIKILAVCEGEKYTESNVSVSVFLQDIPKPVHITSGILKMFQTAQDAM